MRGRVKKIEPRFELCLYGVERLVEMPRELIQPGKWSGWSPQACEDATKPYPIMTHYGDIMAAKIERDLARYDPNDLNNLALFASRAA